jgi:flagellar hook-basal body complex protein FliE
LDLCRLNSMSFSDVLKQIETDMKDKEQSSETRIRVNMHNTLTVKFLDLMTSYQEAQVMQQALWQFVQTTAVNVEDIQRQEC